MIRAVVVAVGLVGVLAACSTPSEREGSAVPYSVAGSGSAAGDPSEVAARGVIARNRSEVIQATGDATLPWLAKFPFNVDGVVLVFGGSRPTGGYALAVTDLRRVGNALQAEARLVAPPENALTTQAFSDPYVALGVSATDLEGITNVTVQVRE